MYDLNFIAKLFLEIVAKVSKNQNCPKDFDKLWDMRWIVSIINLIGLTLTKYLHKIILNV